MGYVKMKPVYGQVCTAWKTEVVDFKEVTDFEDFSSSVPISFSDFDRNEFLPPEGWEWIPPVIQVPPSGYGVELPLETPIPGSGLLFGALLLVIVISNMIKRKLSPL